MKFKNSMFITKLGGILLGETILYGFFLVTVYGILILVYIFPKESLLLFGRSKCKIEPKFSDFRIRLNKFLALTVILFLTFMTVSMFVDNVGVRMVFVFSFVIYLKLEKGEQEKFRVELKYPTIVFGLCAPVLVLLLLFSGIFSATKPIQHIGTILLIISCLSLFTLSSLGRNRMKNWALSWSFVGQRSPGFLIH